MMLIGSHAELCRYQRLVRVLEHMFNAHTATDEHDRNQAMQKVFDKIHQLEDHKGTLTVTWSSPPAQWEKEALFNAWHAEGESEICSVIKDPHG